MSSEGSRVQNPSPADPALVRFTEALTGTTDAVKADGIADMLLIFLSAGGTIIGVFVAAILYVFFTENRPHTVPWMFLLLVCVGGGGVIGCLTVMAVLNAKNLIEWETRKRSN
jgi:peptidoglycan/LPS O-acetylase OafA/YrhL